jgi:hypothetical protein
LLDASTPQELQNQFSEANQGVHHSLQSQSTMSASLDGLDWSTVLNPLESQQWLTPANFPWNQWNLFLDNPQRTQTSMG